MKEERVARILVKAIGYIELVIGLYISLSLIIPAVIFSPGSVPALIYRFVIVTSAISVGIGLGLIRCRRWAVNVLIFFAGYVALSKIFLATGIIVFTGGTITLLPTGLKDLISFFYHVWLIIVLNLPEIKGAVQ